MLIDVARIIVGSPGKPPPEHMLQREKSEHAGNQMRCKPVVRGADIVLLDALFADLRLVRDLTTRNARETRDTNGTSPT